MIAVPFRNIRNRGALIWVSRVASYRGYAAECLALAGNAFSADERGNMRRMAAEWSALADRVEKREGEAERGPPPQPEPVAAQPEKPRNRRTAQKGFPTRVKVSILRAHSTKARKSRP